MAPGVHETRGSPSDDQAVDRGQVRSAPCPLQSRVARSGRKRSYQRRRDMTHSQTGKECLDMQGALRCRTADHPDQSNDNHHGHGCVHHPPRTLCRHHHDLALLGMPPPCDIRHCSNDFEYTASASFAEISPLAPPPTPAPTSAQIIISGGNADASPLARIPIDNPNAPPTIIPFPIFPHNPIFDFSSSAIT